MTGLFRPAWRLRLRSQPQLRSPLVGQCHGGRAHGHEISLIGRAVTSGTTLSSGGRLSSVAAADALPIPLKLVMCVGFGIDAYHGVCHAHFLENVATLAREGAYLGTAALLSGMPEADAYRDAVKHAMDQARYSSSIVNLSILSAIEGDFGDVHRTKRTSNSELFINPLMSLCWGFELEAIARGCLYLPDILETQTALDVVLRIEAFRERITIRPRRPMPV